MAEFTTHSGPRNLGTVHELGAIAKGHNICIHSGNILLSRKQLDRRIERKHDAPTQAKKKTHLRPNAGCTVRETLTSGGRERKNKHYFAQKKERRRKKKRRGGRGKRRQDLVEVSSAHTKGTIKRVRTTMTGEETKEATWQTKAGTVHHALVTLLWNNSLVPA